MAVPTAPPRTARDIARSEFTRSILDVARQHLADHGPADLSLRAIARDLGVASSAVYRYVPSRDALLTNLIVAAYDDLGDAVERAERRVRRSDLLGRWRAACQAVRGWALLHRHDYALLYGSPVPGYAAPQTTIAPATRVPRVLTAILHALAESGGDPGTGPSSVPVPPAVREAIGPAKEVMGTGLSDDLVVRGLMAWSHVFGTVSFELFGHYVGVVADSDAYFDHEIDRLAASVGLLGERSRST